MPMPSSAAEQRVFAIYRHVGVVVATDTSPLPRPVGWERSFLSASETLPETVGLRGIELCGGR